MLESVFAPNKKNKVDKRSFLQETELLRVSKIVSILLDTRCGIQFSM